jgi:glycosyltransferase involved in cell wall biosynthesis
MAEKPFFSIVIPTYNRADLIGQTLESVFAQTFQSYEVIVVDNASTDHTPALLAPLVAEGKLRLIVHDRNYERAKSRNTGMAAAQGQYLTFLDSDDFMYPQNLAEAYQYIKQNPENQAFHNLYELVDAQQQLLYRYPFAPLREPLRQIAQGNFLSCIGVFLHQDLYRTLRWDEHPLLTGSEDYDFALRLVARCPQLGRIPRYNSGVREHPARTVNQQHYAQALERFEYLRHKMATDPEYLPLRPFAGQIAATLWIFLAGMALSTQQTAEAGRALSQARQADKKVWSRLNYLGLWLRYCKKRLMAPFG